MFKPTHIVMPMKVRVISIVSALTDENFQKCFPHLSVKDTARKHPDWKIVYTEKNWVYLDGEYITSLQLSLRELPHAQEFPFGVDGVVESSEQSKLADEGTDRECGEILSDSTEEMPLAPDTGSIVEVVNQETQPKYAIGTCFECGIGIIRRIREIDENGKYWMDNWNRKWSKGSLSWEDDILDFWKIVPDPSVQNTSNDELPF